MASRQVTLGESQKKSDAVIASAGSASGNIIVQFDDTLSSAEVAVLMEKVVEVILEQEY